jgi:hypothetical protein
LFLRLAFAAQNTSLAQQALRSRSRRVLIMGQAAAKALRFHHCKLAQIGQAPALVRRLLVTLQA